MELKKLTFTPNNEMKGLEIIRNMKSLEALGVVSEQHCKPVEFWKRFDAGEFKK